MPSTHVVHSLHHKHFFPTYLDQIAKDKINKETAMYASIHTSIKSNLRQRSLGSQVLSLPKHLQIFYDNGDTIANH